MALDSFSRKWEQIVSQSCAINCSCLHFWLSPLCNFKQIYQFPDNNIRNLIQAFRNDNPGIMRAMGGGSSMPQLEDRSNEMAYMLM